MALRQDRLYVYRDRAGEWRYYHQSRNGRVDDAPEEGFARRATALDRGRRRWPDAEVIVDDQA